MGARILVADDSVTIQKVVELTFSKEDFVLVQARSGEETIRKALEVRPDLVLVDLVMPDKNGYEVCAALRAEPTLRSVPIILLTGTFESFDKEQGLQAGADDFVTKPFESQVLISKVKRLLFARMVAKGDPAMSPGAGKSTSPRAEAALVQPAPFATPPSAPPIDMPPPAAPPPSEPARLDFDLSPPTEEITQDHLWQLLDAAASPPAPRMPDTIVELSLDLAPPGPATAQESPPDLPPLEPQSAEMDRALGTPLLPGQAGEAEVVPRPESLSLEELLSTPPEAPAPMAEIKPLDQESAPGEPVFDLTADMGAPPLPLREVGAGEPSALSVEDLLGSTAAALPASGAAPVDIADLDLGAMEEGQAKEGLPAAGASASAPPLDLEVPAEMSPGRADSSLPEAPPLEGLESRALLMGRDQTDAASPPILDIPPRADAAEAPTAAELLERAASPLGAGVEAEQETIPFAPQVPAVDIASMRETVTERVARDLARELSDKLVDRIEKIVWEVVPDLAEILITKEIERIRAIAENQKSS
ncbi:MAG TPA: response regulator [Candidatus Methylomirabilis sp.]|nr:response regulator [Candidatus Methylomirabilis sp.]